MLKKLLLSLTLISSFTFTGCDLSGSHMYRIIYVESDKAYYTYSEGSSWFNIYGTRIDRNVSDIVKSINKFPTNVLIHQNENGDWDKAEIIEDKINVK